MAFFSRVWTKRISSFFLRINKLCKLQFTKLLHPSLIVNNLLVDVVTTTISGTEHISNVLSIYYKEGTQAFPSAKSRKMVLNTTIRNLILHEVIKWNPPRQCFLSKQIYTGAKRNCMQRNVRCSLMNTNLLNFRFYLFTL